MIPPWEKCGTWLLRGEPNACRRLGKHDLGQMPVQVFQLYLALQAKNNKVSALAGLGDGRIGTDRGSWLTRTDTS